MASYVKGFLVLFVLVSVLLHLPPGKTYQKYIRFFSQFILTLALLAPVLRFFGDKDAFLELIAYEKFTEELAAVSRDMKQVEYLYSDYHKEAYEDAIAEDVGRIAESHSFAVQGCEVCLSKEYEVERISLIVGEKNEEDAISGILLKDDVSGETEEIIFSELKKELTEFYGIDASKITIAYESG